MRLPYAIDRFLFFMHSFPYSIKRGNGRIWSDKWRALALLCCPVFPITHSVDSMPPAACSIDSVRLNYSEVKIGKWAIKYWQTIYYFTVNNGQSAFSCVDGRKVKEIYWLYFFLFHNYYKRALLGVTNYKMNKRGILCFPTVTATYQ